MLRWALGGSSLRPPVGYSGGTLSRRAQIGNLGTLLLRSSFHLSGVYLNTTRQVRARHENRMRYSCAHPFTAPDRILSNACRAPLADHPRRVDVRVGPAFTGGAMKHQFQPTLSVAMSAPGAGLGSSTGIHIPHENSFFRTENVDTTHSIIFPCRGHI